MARQGDYGRREAKKPKKGARKALSAAPTVAPPVAVIKVKGKKDREAGF